MTAEEEKATAIVDEFEKDFPHQPWFTKQSRHKLTTLISDALEQAYERGYETGLDQGEDREERQKGSRDYE